MLTVYLDMFAQKNWYVLVPWDIKDFSTLMQSENQPQMCPQYPSAGGMADFPPWQKDNMMDTRREKRRSFWVLVVFQFLGNILWLDICWDRTEAFVCLKMTWYGTGAGVHFFPDINLELFF